MENKSLSKRIFEGIQGNVLTLGVVSGLTDIASEMLYPLMPLFLTATLGAPMAAVGLIEGCAEATASLLKTAGGYWSDKTGKRKPFVVWGYGLSAISKPLMALAFSWTAVLAARIVDRVGKGLRTSARDALIAASADRKYWGKAFGFHRAMDTMGAAMGPVIALVLMHYFGLGFRPIFVIAFIPAVLGVMVLIKFTRELPSPMANTAAAARPPFWESLSQLSPEFKTFLIYYGIFALGNSSDVFLLLKAKSVGFTASHVIMAYICYNAVYALCAAPAGWLSDKLGRKKTMAFGFLVFSAVYLGFALTKSQLTIWILFAVYGFYGAFNEGIAKALVADISGPENRATAMGAFQGMAGVLALVTSLAAGIMWDAISPAAPFVLGAVCAAVSALLMLKLKIQAACPS